MVLSGICYSVSITAGFVGWMMYIVILLLRGHSNIATWHYGVNVTGDNKRLTFAFVLAGIGITLFLYGQLIIIIIIIIITIVVVVFIRRTADLDRLINLKIT